MPLCQGRVPAPLQSLVERAAKVVIHPNQHTKAPYMTLGALGCQMVACFTLRRPLALFDEHIPVLGVLELLGGPLKGASLRILDMAIDTSTPNGRLMLSILGSDAQFERKIMLERQREGIAKAKAEGMRLIKVLAENWCRNRYYTHVKTTLAPRRPPKFKT